MTESPPIELMWTALERCNGDRVEVSQAIDLLLDLGETPLADTFRWMLDNEKWPADEDTLTGKEFLWRHSRIWQYYSDPDQVRREIFKHLPINGSGVTGAIVVALGYLHTRMRYNTFPDAINALRVALETLKIIGYRS